VVRGVNIYPRAVEELVQLVGGVAEYQVNVNARQALVELSLQIEPDPNCADPAALAERLEKKFQASFGLRVPVAAVGAGSLPRFEMKARRWVRV
jgi:phenylacetate-CoA ligase